MKCEVCGKEMVKDGEGMNYARFICPKCGFTRVISWWKELGLDDTNNSREPDK